MHAVEINYWQASPVANDLLLTAFLLPFIMCMNNSRLIAAKVYKGELDDIAAFELGERGWYRRSVFVRSAFLGVLCVVVYAVPTVLILPVTWAEPLSIWGFVSFKAVWAAVLTILVCPFIAVWAIADASVEKLDAANRQ